MGLSSFRWLTALQAILLVGLVITALHPAPAGAQTFCGPTTPINFNGSNGSYPFAGVTFDSQGNMYGTTTNGGASGLGTVWKYTSSAGLTQLFNFSGSSSPSNNGDRPMTPLLIDGQGNLYGATYYGGNNFSGDGSGSGTVFKLSSSGQFTELHQFSGPDGASPLGALLLDSAGNLWGTTFQGGNGWNPPNNYGDGTIFKYSSGTVTNPVLFNISDGENTYGGMATDGTNYYGTTYQGGANSFGTLFQYNSTTGQLTTLFNFNRYPNGSYPIGAVTYDGKGNLYGTTYEGGGHSSASNYCCGTVWKYSLSSGTMTTLVSFDGDTVPADGMFPEGGVTLDSSGNLYGTTSQGGSFSDGIVYEYSSTGTLSSLVTFTGSNGQLPEGNLAFDSSGNLWGITHQGGASGYGTVYELTPNTNGGACSGDTVSSLTFNPTSFPNGHSTTGTVTLSAAAPSGGSVVALSDDNASVLNVPSSVTVPAGATTATFTATANNLFVLSNTLVTTTATLGNSTTQGTVTVTTGIAVTSISLNPRTVTAGNSTTATVTIASPAPSGGNEVLISTNNNNTAAVETMKLPITVTVPAGQTSVSFSLGTNCETFSVVAPIYGQSGGATISTNLTVNAASSCGTTVSSVTLNPTSVTGGSSSTGTVTISPAAPSGGSVVALNSNSSSASVPGSVTVPSGSTSATFTVTTTSVSSTTTAVITATLGSSSQQASLTITPASSVTLSSLTLNPTSVSGGNSSTGTVTLTGAAPSGGATVTLSSSNTSVATVPSSITVQAGNTSASFTVNTQRVSSNTNVAISGLYAGATKSATLTVTGRNH
jgi:uncharacterized repeat protein (TIGR03803 family)